jgi:calcineurin-like phosphoesterase family protein
MKWFIADPHFGHNRILSIACRPFSSVTAMNSHIISNINKYVRKSDYLYILGDFCFDSEGEYYRQQINAQNIYFIRGNHDCDEKHVASSYDRLFTHADNTRMIKLSNNKGGDQHESFHCWLSHYPHAFWPKSHYGAMHVYGHHHCQREEYLDKVWPNRRSMDVGVDNIYRLYGEYRPVSEVEILSILSARTGHHNLEHEHSYTKNKELAMPTSVIA